MEAALFQSSPAKGETLDDLGDKGNDTFIGAFDAFVIN